MNKKETELLSKIKTKIETKLRIYEDNAKAALERKDWDSADSYKDKQIAMLEFQIWLLEEKF